MALNSVVVSAVTVSRSGGGYEVRSRQKWFVSNGTDDAVIQRPPFEFVHSEPFASKAEAIEAAREFHEATDPASLDALMFPPTHGEFNCPEIEFVVKGMVNAAVMHASLRGDDTATAHSSRPLVEIAGPLGVTCPACYAGPGHPCNAPKDTGRRDVKWFHSKREDLHEELERKRAAASQ